MKFQLPDGAEREIPDEWWTASGMNSFVAATPHYRLKTVSQEGWSPLIVPLSEIEPINRTSGHFDFCGMDRERMSKILSGIARDESISPIYVKTNVGRYRFALYDGFHRYHAAIAAGFSQIPALISD